MRKKWFVWVLIVAAAALVLYAAVPAAVGLFAVTHDDLLLKEAYNNPIINEGYPGWQPVSAPEICAFMLPQEWTLTAEGGMLTLMDADGALAAQGCVLRRADDAYGSVDQEEYLSDLSSAVGFEVTDTQTSGITAFTTAHGCDFIELTALGDGQATKLLCLELKGESASLWLWFPECRGEEFMTLLDNAEAITYAFLYGAEGKG